MGPCFRCPGRRPLWALKLSNAGPLEGVRGRLCRACAHVRPLARQLIARLAQQRLTIHEPQAQVLPVACGIPWLGFVVYPTHRRLKRRLAINFTRRLAGLLADY